MKEEISKLLRTTKVTTTSDLSEIVLEKLRKADLISVVLSLVTVCENNIDQCKSAAEKSDELKDSKIIYQKEIIEAQKSQLNSVQKTVKTKLKSWADVLRDVAKTWPIK